MKVLKTNRIVLFFLLVFISGFVSAQKKEKIKILNSNSLEFSEKIGIDVRRFLGNVIFEHNFTKMYCDSAYLYGNENTIHAFSSVHINRGDSIHMYGDYLEYNGNTNQGKVRNNVTLHDNQISLTTDSLDFNSQTNIVNYQNGGEIVNDSNTLTSYVGYYYSDKDLFFYKDSVVLITPDYKVETDTLKYNTRTKISYFLGPTDISNKEDFLYCENGWYDSQEKKFQFNKNAYYKNKEKILKGDSLYYDKLNGIGKAFVNVELIDTAQNIKLTGNVAKYVKEPESFFITDSAMLTSVSNENDSVFMHADTIRSDYDSLKINKIIRAYNKVKIYKNDIQSKCDSLVFTQKDSVISMYNNPIVWSGENQVTADTIIIFTKNSEIDYIKLNASPFVISQEDTARYNQIKGKKMIAYVRDNQIYKVDVIGNGQAIYYTKDKNEIVGINKSESSSLVLYLKEKQITRIVMLQKPDGTLFPLGELKEVKLKDFEWQIKYRPQSKYDIFKWKE
ncbi:MAG: organic solvent tolerance protein OstA [Bacteroidales bacterium]|jgi:lipopolysaccharide export system protein LptA|nr:organic solvent tolerance protein OstA [Bacteroidales bacterium]